MLENILFVGHLKLLMIITLEFLFDTDSSRETDSSSENTCSFSEESSDNVNFYRWQIVEKKIKKSKVDVKFKDAVEIFKDDIKTLKEYIYNKKR